jgi:5,5'-dehydrodivanillate O-demethylase
MGELMRRYWQPVCASDELLRSPFRTKEVTIMSEELVIYRDRSGTLGCVDKYCTHRRASLAYGVVEEEGIRCQYHGWKFNETGACIEQPFEDTTHPEDNFRDKCGIKNYPVQELCGLVFVYMGPAPAPLLPRWGPLVYENCVHDIAIANLPCNWLQCQENSLDSTHTEHLHGYAGTYFKRVTAGQDPAFGRTADYHIKIGYDAFKHGIIKRRVRQGHDENNPEWRLGHPILFPNILWVGNTLQYRVPATDETCLHITLYTWRGAPGSTVPKQDVIPSRIVPLYDENGYFVVDILFNQDYMCWYTQGPIARRDLEKLGESDKGIILFRQMLKQQMDIVADGGEPTMNIFRTPEENRNLTDPAIPNESNHWLGGGDGGGQGPRDLARVRDDDGRPRTQPFVYVPGEAGYSRDADKIVAAMRTWEGFDKERLAALREGRERISAGAE